MDKFRRINLNFYAPMDMCYSMQTEAISLTNLHMDHRDDINSSIGCDTIQEYQYLNLKAL